VTAAAALLFSDVFAAPVLAPPGGRASFEGGWTMRPIVPVAIAALVFAMAGCSKKPSAEREASPGTAAHTTPAVETAPSPAPGSATGGAGTPGAGEIQLAGTLGCGHCNFHATSECAATVKTASGDIYVLDGVDEKSDLWQKRLEPGHTITVVGKVVGDDAVKHVAMTSFEFD
jgi:hypothetical protein